MDEERPSPVVFKPVTPSEEAPTLTEIQQMEQSDEKLTSRKPSTLIVIGFVVVLGLILTGLLLPPISLLERLGGGDDTVDATVPVDDQSALPSGISFSSNAQMSNSKVKAIAQAEFMADPNWAAAAAALPGGAALKSSVYALDFDGGSAPAGQAALAFAADAALMESVDLYGWNGTEWGFIPSQIDYSTGQIVSMETPLPQALVLLQLSAPELAAIGAELLPTQALATEVLPLLTEVSAGTLTLSGNGELMGEAAPTAIGPYDQLLRVTNTGAIVDQASVAGLLADVTLQNNQVNLLLGQSLSAGFAGVNLDYQGIVAGQEEAFTSFVQTLADALHSQGRTLVVTLAAPTKVNNSWDSAGQDWAKVGQIADAVYLQMPLDPAAFNDNGDAEQLLKWGTRLISRDKISLLLSANAIDRIGESFMELANTQALANFGELQFVKGSSEIEPGSAVEVALSGTASPLEWDGASLTYKYSYEQSGQTHHVWLGSEAVLSHQLRLAQRYNLRGISVRGLGQVSEGAGFAASFGGYLGTAEPPQPVGAAIVWTVRSIDNSVLASSSGDSIAFSWEGTQDPGEYSINAEFALGNSVANLGSLQVAVASAEVEEVVEVEPTPEPAATATPAPQVDASYGDADAVVNTGANVRVGPGLTYGTIAGGAEKGYKVSLIGRNSDASWINIIMPDGSTEGWIYVTLLTINPAVDVNALAVITVDPPVVSDGNGGTTAPPPVTAPPVTNSGFELGGQTHGFANPTLMSYAGMNWVKFQHKWGPGDSPDAVAGRIQQAHANGFKVLLSIPGSDHSNIDYNAYANFVGGVAALGPDAIEIWNEMNIDREWPSGQIDPGAYVNNMLAPAYNAIKAAKPSVMVISGAPAPTGYFGGCGGGGCDDNAYMAGMAAAGGANYMDCIGIHYNEGIISPNATSGDPRASSSHYTRYFWGMVNTYWNAFGGSRPLCFTELGYLTGVDYGGLPGGFAWASSTTIPQHAQWLAEAASLSASSGKVRLMIVFNVDFTHYSADPQAGYAMIRKDGSCPSCESLRQVMGR